MGQGHKINNVILCMLSCPSVNTVLSLANQIENSKSETQEKNIDI